MSEDQPYTTVPALAKQFADGKYHQVYHLIRKGALEAHRPKPYRVLVSTTAAELIFGPSEPPVTPKL